LNDANPKTKSRLRFQQLNHIVDIIAPTLPSPSMIAILLTCFRHANVQGYFRVSTSRIARSSGVQVRQTKRLIDHLMSLGVLKFVKERRGSVPRTYQINYEYPRGVTHDTTNT
jgi:hypothetical protein